VINRFAKKRKTKKNEKIKNEKNFQSGQKNVLRCVMGLDKREDYWNRIVSRDENFLSLNTCF
jgi:hypothetical protein